MTDRDPERSAQAGEYVLGTLTPEERRAFEQAATGDPELRRAQRQWESRLAGLGLKLPPVAPRPLVWLDVLQRISGGGAARAPAAARPSRLTQAWAALATAASLVLGFGLYRETTQPPETRVERVEVPVPAETYVAYLQVPQSTMFWTVAAVPGRNELAVRAGGEAPAAAKDLDAELWLITQAGDAISLGVIPKDGEVHRSLPAGLALGEGGTVAVSLEPRGGSPTGKPTGPVVSSAKVLQAS
jgi:anti-sigma-K factor RskA